MHLRKYGICCVFNRYYIGNKILKKEAPPSNYRIDKNTEKEKFYYLVSEIL